MADLSKVHAVFGTTLPEAHIFFATVANTEIPSYQVLRKHLGKTTAHTNRSLWKLFVAEYSAAYPAVPLAFTTNLPTTKTATVGDDVTFTTAVTGGDTPYTYKWYWNTTLIDSGVNPTAATAALVNHAVEVASAGAYKVEVTDSKGKTITSVACALTVNPAP